MQEVYAVIPVKNPFRAKSRLSTHLTRKERAELVIAMLKDVLHAIRGLVVPVVVSPVDLSRYADGCELVRDRGRGLKEAVEAGVAHALNKGAKATLFIPADTPLLSREVVKRVLELGRDYQLVLTPAKRGGVGIVYKRPPDVLPEKFSNSSFRDILNLAEEKGIEYTVYNSKEVELDIDTWEDVREFLATGKGTQTYKVLSRIAARYYQDVPEVF